MNHKILIKQGKKQTKNNNTTQHIAHGTQQKKYANACVFMCTTYARKLMSLYACGTLIKYYIISRFIYSLAMSLSLLFALIGRF